MASVSVSKVAVVGEVGNDDKVGDGVVTFLWALLRPGETDRKCPVNDEAEVELRLEMDLAVVTDASLRGCLDFLSSFLSRCSFLVLRSGSVQTTSHMLHGLGPAIGEVE